MQKYCPNCVKPLTEAELFCPDCGTAANYQKKSSSQSEFDKFIGDKEPFVAAVLSLICPGLGQVYNGEFFKGLFIQIPFLISACVLYFLFPFSILIIPIPIFLWAVSIYDAHKKADKMIKGKVAFMNPTLKEVLIFILWPIVLVVAFFVILIVILIIAFIGIIIASL